jgi:hypothetical protein
LCPSEEAKEFRLDSLENEITALENECSGDYQWIGFCHNDLQYGNIMIDEETNVLTIIVSDTFHILTILIIVFGCTSNILFGV